MDIEKLIKDILQCIYNVRGVLGPGYLESVYRNALIIELQLHGIRAACEVPLKVMYKGVLVGEFRADMIVEDSVIVELKAVESLDKFHGVQLVNYLTITGIETGLLVNFGSDPIQIRRKFRDYTPKKK